MGVIGSYLEDRMESGEEAYVFKNHYIMNAYDTEIIHQLLQAIHEKRQIEITNFSRRADKEKHWHMIPIKLYVSTQGGRNYLICKSVAHGNILSYQIDYLQKVTLENVVENYDEIVAEFSQFSRHMWGVTCYGNKRLEHIEMDIHVGKDEDFIVRRLYREKRCGKITKVDEETYRFVADVYDAYEMVPWIRSFFGRIIKIKCSNETVTNQLKADIVQLAKQYGVLE